MIEQQLDEAILEAIATLIVVLDREGTIGRFNPACERLTGYAQADVLGKCVWDLFVPLDQRQWAADAFAEVLDGTSSGSCECDWITPNGRCRIRWTNAVLAGPDGAVTLVVCSGTDITRQHYSEELNRRIIETVPGGIVLVDKDGGIRRANAEAERFLGLRFDPDNQAYVSDFRNKTVYEDGSDFPVEDYPVSKCLRTGKPQPPATIGVVRPDGQISWGLFTATPVHDPSGHPHNGAVVTLLDISERVRGNEALRASEERFRAAFEDAAVGMALTDLQGRFQKVNGAYAAVTGYSEKELQGLTFSDITHPDDRETNLKLARRMARGEAHSGTFEKRYIRKDGQSVWVHGSASVVRDRAGKPAGWIAVIEDTSERMRAQEALGESEERFRQLAAAIDGVFWMVDVERNQSLYVSPGYERLWGRSLESLHLNPVSFLDAVHPDDKAVVLAVMHRSHAGEVEYRIIRPDGTVAWIRDRSFPIRNAAGHVHRICGIAEDVTERKRTEQAVRAMNEHLEKLVEQRTEAARDSERHYREVAEHNRLLVQEVEHRVRNNLAGLLGLVSVMQERVKDVKTFAGAIEGRLRAMAHVHQLLAKAEWRSLDLRFLLESAIASMDFLSACPAAVELEGERLLVPPRRVLPLTLILLEWLTNSCKYGAHSAPGGGLRVRWEVAPSPRGQRVHLRWTERGGPRINGPVAPSLGTELVHAFASRELGGRCEMLFPPDGAEHHLEFLIGHRTDVTGDAPDNRTISPGD